MSVDETLLCSFQVSTSCANYPMISSFYHADLKTSGEEEQVPIRRYEHGWTAYDTAPQTEEEVRRKDVESSGCLAKRQSTRTPCLASNYTVDVGDLRLYNPQQSILDPTSSRRKELIHTRNAIRWSFSSFFLLSFFCCVSSILSYQASIKRVLSIAVSTVPPFQNCPSLVPLQSQRLFPTFL
jgi:hypothetical protein